MDFKNSVEALEKCAIKDEFENRGFGGMKVQIGCYGGRRHVLNCLEYHKSSEFQIALDDVVVLLGSQKDIENGSYDPYKCKAFFVPKGTGIEIYATTLHYQPMHIDDDGYHVATVQPYGTGARNPDFISKDTQEDKLNIGRNSWLMAHPHTEDADYRYVGLTGRKIIFDMLEF